MSYVCVEDYEKQAESRLDDISWGHYASGATTEHTLRDNLEVYYRYMIRPRVLRDVSNVDLRTTILGYEIPFPIGIAPMGMQCRAHCDGERATARASARLGTCMVLSSSSTVSLEDVAKEGGNNVQWFQLFFYKDKNLTLNLIRRAERAGYKALVLTIDTPEIGQRYTDERHNFALPPHLTMANFKTGTEESSVSSTVPGSALRMYSKSLLDPSFSWESVEWLGSVTELPIILKGIMRAEDAQIALHCKVHGIIVSNHGARQLDGVPSTIDVLPEIVSAINGKMEIYIDGGIRHGTDIFKALALGAKAVFVGRPILWGLICKGEEGVYEVMNILKEELRQALVLSGCTNVGEVYCTDNLVVHESYYKTSKL